MPAWPGGPCPTCGDDMPPRMISCRSCRTLLNTDLRRETIAPPEFVALPELDGSAVTDKVPEIQVLGYHADCPHCRLDLKIALKYSGERVVCKHCDHAFLLDLAHPQFAEARAYLNCLHCAKKLQFARKYVGRPVACRFCKGAIRPVLKASSPSSHDTLVLG